MGILGFAKSLFGLIVLKSCPNTRLLKFWAPTRNSRQIFSRSTNWPSRSDLVSRHAKWCLWCLLHTGKQFSISQTTAKTFFRIIKAVSRNRGSVLTTRWSACWASNLSVTRWSLLGKSKSQRCKDSQDCQPPKWLVWTKDDQLFVPTGTPMAWSIPIFRFDVLIACWIHHWDGWQEETLSWQMCGFGWAAHGDWASMVYRCL